MIIDLVILSCRSVWWTVFLIISGFLAGVKLEGWNSFVSGRDLKMAPHSRRNGGYWGCDAEMARWRWRLLGAFVATWLGLSRWWALPGCSVSPVGCEPVIAETMRGEVGSQVGATNSVVCVPFPLGVQPQRTPSRATDGVGGASGHFGTGQVSVQPNCRVCMTSHGGLPGEQIQRCRPTHPPKWLRQPPT